MKILLPGSPICTRHSLVYRIYSHHVSVTRSTFLGILNYLLSITHNFNNFLRQREYKNKILKGHRKIANKARPQYFTDKHDTIWSKYYVLHIYILHVYELVKSTKNVFIAQEKDKMFKKS